MKAEVDESPGYPCAFNGWDLVAEVIVVIYAMAVLVVVGKGFSVFEFEEGAIFHSSAGVTLPCLYS